MNLQAACCIQIIDVGSQKVESSKEISLKRQIIIGWELLSPAKTSSKQGQIIYKIYPMSWDVESQLRKDVEGWSGRSQSEQSSSRFNVKSLLGKFHRLEFTSTSERNEEIFQENLKVVSLPEDIDQSTLPKPYTPFRIFMISEPDMEFFDQLPKEIQEKIKLSPEFEWAQKAATDEYQ